MSSNESDPVVDSRLLLIEDSQDHQFLFINLLNKIGIHNIIVYETGEQAVDRIKTDPNFDLLIVDYSLPGKSGIDVIREVRLLDPEIPIIMITAFGSEKIAVQAMKLGIQDYFTKDDLIEKDSLKKIIEQTLLEYQAHKESILSNRLASNPNQLSISVFKFGKIGPEPFITSHLPFEGDISEIEKENFLIKIGTHYMTATGTGHDYTSGLFELPVPNYNKYRSLVYGFQMKEKKHSDARIQQQSGINYGLVVIIFPVLYRSILPSRSAIEKRLGELISVYSDMDELDEHFVERVKRIFYSNE